MKCILQIDTCFAVFFTDFNTLRHIFQLVGSAPGFPHGCIDDLEAIAAVSRTHLCVKNVYMYV